ncbi:asparagine synthetase-related protein [Monoraphidium neglectum]|uniref:Asparagine synthetase-related protein n=1 Tax=Monoraphidium neglectum TaxID=145388 RepID=A0A0D2NGG3_9CHLO|nr:asparagine synthetase-related protein [Monoraphidium neglectum]KIZ04111.1 asparagine synthetase-related protein [Monoraphidium neglectum]|eukprot:XP_013903130.1 asparagine synthetase-related protein [Monoraphidium neglectum]
MVEPLTATEGSWFAYLTPRPTGVAGWLLPRKDSAKKVARLISAVSASWQDDAPVADLSASFNDAKLPASCPAPTTAAATAAAGGAAAGAAVAPGACPGGQAVTNSSHSFIFPCGGLTVKQGLYSLASDLYRVAPFVHCAPDSSAAVAFVGHLSNLQELAARYCSPSGTPKRAGSDDNNYPAPAGSLARAGSIGRSRDMGALTAAVVLSMYQSEDELVLLSELQGQFAFIVLDNAKRQAFAARDPSGAETLFYRIGDDGSAAFASSSAAIPEDDPADAAGGGDWRELPPGHFISKGHTLQQFALTPAQLQVRELNGNLAPRAPAPRPPKGRASLENNIRQGRDLESLDLFGFGMDV